jgi:L-2-hydroxyglutarate oxidase LhgO
VAAQLSVQGREVLILERENSFGMATSARNSEVIHAGIYYRPGSLKAKLCVQGKHAMYRYCQERAVAHKRCGKLIVATSTSQVRQLAAISKNAQANGVDDLGLLTAEQACALEPDLHCHAALLSPSTGIVDSHALMLSLLGDAENSGATLVTQAVVSAVEHDSARQCHSVHVNQAGESSTLRTRYLINAAGHGACAIAASMQQLPEALRPQPVYYKGNYFSLQGRAPFNRLVYPVPEQGGLGVHITIDLAGKARFGPDVEPVNDENYQVDPERAQTFYAAIRRYWPALKDDSLMPDYAGVRPRVMYQNQLHDDFLIQDASQHTLDGLINLFSIESPGLTASLAIAQEVSSRLEL